MGEGTGSGPGLSARVSRAEELSKGLPGEASCLKDKSRVSPGTRELQGHEEALTGMSPT